MALRRCSLSALACLATAGTKSPFDHLCPNIGMQPSHRVASQIIGEICLTIGGFDQVDGFGLT